MNDTQKKPVKDPRRIWIYIGALFLVSLILILFSYFSQLRMQRELAEANENFSEKLETTSGALKSAESAVELAREQGKEISELQSRISALEAENDDQRKRISELENDVKKASESLNDEILRSDAVTVLYRMSENIRARSWSAAKTDSETLAENGLEEHLRDEDREKLEDLRKTLSKHRR